MSATRKKQYLVILLVSAFLVIIIYGTKNSFAALKMESSTVKNSFTAMEDSIPSINETLTNDPDNAGYILEKDDVTVTNTNEFDVSVRAIVIASWQDADGNTLAATPSEGTDYTITYGDDWELRSDGFYYYKSILGKNESTTPLLTDCKPIKKAPSSGYTLNINIVSQTVQTINDNGELPY